MDIKVCVPQKVEKPWGFELIFAHTERYAGKVLSIKKGHRLSLQYHEKKDESLYLYKGEVLLRIEDVNGQKKSIAFKSGESIRFEPLTQHRMEAIEDSVLFEVSTPELEDVKRVEDDYGRVK